MPSRRRSGCIADDDVVIARDQLVSGTTIASEGVTVVRPDSAGPQDGDARASRPAQPVRRYSQIIGFASQPIRARPARAHPQPGDGRVRARLRLRRRGARAHGRAAEPATFQGIVRADGRVATRNYIGILTSVNCSATVARAIADHFRRDIHPEALADFPNVDGVVALTHGSGCAVDPEGEGLAILRRTLGGYACHPELRGVLMIGLGCETNQIREAAGHARPGSSSDRLHAFTIQDTGGTTEDHRARHRADQGDAAARPTRCARQTVPASHLVVGLQCGGSDGYSGITANPALGAAVDLLVRARRHGDPVGDAGDLRRRAPADPPRATPEVGRKLVERIRWWEDYCARNGAEMDNNPSAGNKAGGLTTVLEKSLGGIAKGGSTNLVDVYEYAEPVTAAGLVFMDTPGYDPVSATGQVAGGANLICFTTGRGSAYGCAPSPSVKLATNTALWQRQADDMDINCGEILDGTQTHRGDRRAQLFQLMLDTRLGPALAQRAARLWPERVRALADQRRHLRG